MLSCQQESTWMGSPDYEMDYIQSMTGKLPAMRGLDFMNNDFSGVVKRSKEWHDKGGIVTICWHTGVKSSGYRESLDDTTDFESCSQRGTDEYNTMIAGWDKAAAALAELAGFGRCRSLGLSMSLTVNGSGGARAAVRILLSSGV